MNVVAHIEASLRRGCSPYTLEQAWAAIFSGRGGLAIGDAMSGSWYIHEDEGCAEVVHLAGRWNEDDARYITQAMQDDLEARGLPRDAFRFDGRRGWRRFLRMRRFDP